MARMIHSSPSPTHINARIATGLALPPETNSADWVLDLTTSSTTVQGGKTLTEAYQQRKPEAFPVRFSLPLPRGVVRAGVDFVEPRAIRYHD